MINVDVLNELIGRLSTIRVCFQAENAQKHRSTVTCFFGILLSMKTKMPILFVYLKYR